MSDIKKISKAKFETEKKGKKEHYKHHLILGNFEEFDFDKLLNEDKGKDYEGILWKNGKVKRDLKVEEDDIVYIYYTNLPDRINRILIKCRVLEKDCLYCETPEEEEKMLKGEIDKIPAIRLKFENALCVNSDKEKFSQEALFNKYGINNLQGKQHLKEDLLQKNNDNKLEEYYQRKLIEDLEKACNSKKYKNYSLEQLAEDMNKMSKCTLENCKGLKDANHNTFQKENGMNYYEAHHLIEQCNGRKDKKFPKEIIDNPKNIINLCPNCHKRIHNGKKDDRKLMVTYLYKKNKDVYNDLLSRVEEVKDGEEPLKWLLKQYGIDN
ncbi:MAG: HNH endonuclease [Clostridia bacterium]|nr:HNH endonuclease [Clostridia bacterium]